MNLKNTDNKLYIDTVEAVTENTDGFREVAGITDGTDIISTDDLLRVDGDLIRDKINQKYNLGRVVNMWYEYDTTSRTIGQSLTTGKTWITKNKKAGNDIVIHWHIPSRGWIDGWSGVYHHIEYSANGGAWTSMGNTGYDGGIMYSGAQAIGSQSGTIYVNITEVRDATSIRFRFRHIQYGTGTAIEINTNHAITAGALGWGFTSITTQEIGV